MLSYLSYMVSAMEMLALLLQNTGTFTHITEHLKPYTEFCGYFPWANGKCEQQWCGEVDVLATVQQGPNTGIHRISRLTGLTQKQVWRILHRDGFCLYQLQRIQQLLPGDHTSFLWICERLQPCLQILPDILFTDEAEFTQGDNTNREFGLLDTEKSAPRNTVSF